MPTTDYDGRKWMTLYNRAHFRGNMQQQHQTAFWFIVFYYCQLCGRNGFFFEKYVQWMRNCCWRRFPPSRIEDISWSSTWLYASNLRCIPPGSTSSESLNFFCVWYSTLGFMYNIVFVILVFCFFVFIKKREKTKDYKISAVSLLFCCCYFCC